MPSTEETSQNAAANTEDAVLHDAIPLKNVVIAVDSSSHTSSDEEEAECRQKTVVHYSSDSKILPHRIKPAYHGTVSTSLNTHSTRKYHQRAQSRLYKYHGSFIKSIAQEPPDASEQDVARAQAKLFNKSQKLEMYVSVLFLV